MKRENLTDQAVARDFPTERLEAEHVARREFAKMLCVVSAGFVAGSAWVATKDELFPKHRVTEPVRVCAVGELAVGGMLTFAIASVPYLLMRLSEHEWSALEQKCTHLSCAVFYAPEQGRVECPCHHGAFDPRSGDVLYGPPPRPLPRLAATVRDGAVFVSEPEPKANGAHPAAVTNACERDPRSGKEG